MMSAALRINQDSDQELVLLAGKRSQEESNVSEVLNLKNTQRYSERLSAISHFTVEIANQLNNSLTPIICYAQLLSQRESAPEALKRLTRIADAAYQAKEIIDGMMSFASAQPAQPAQLDISLLVRETIETAEGLFWIPSRQIHFEPQESLPCIEGDSHQITQALLHLIKNAMQATDHEARSIVIRAFQTESGQVCIEVNDNGSGIPEAILPKVLLPFFTTRKGEGVGLGLSIVNGIAEAHGAELSIQTSQGKGTSIKLLFPIND